MNSFERFVGFRYLASKKKQTLLSLTTWISVGGVSTGVMALIIVISVMNGFGKDLRDKILSFKSHLLIESKEFLPFEVDPKMVTHIQKADPRIQEVTPYILSEMIIRRGSTVTGVLLKGVSASFFKTLPPARKSTLPSILLGQELAGLLGVLKGDVVEVLSPLETTGPFGVLPKTRKYEVRDLIATGVYEYDTKLAYVLLSEAQDFLDYGNKIDGFELKVSDIYATKSIQKNLKELSMLSSFEVRDWQELNRNLLSALKLEKMAMYVILSFIILVAALNIMTTLARLVLEKKREISILKAMGAQRIHILMIFLFQGLWIGMGGILLGLVGGIGVCLALDRFQLIRLPDIYYNTSVPVDMEGSHLFLIALIAFGISLFSSLYPAWRASKLDPLEGIRY